MREITFTAEITDKKLVKKFKERIKQEELKRENWLYQQDNNSRFWC